MDLEVVTVGTELLLGFTLDSNAADIARTLSRVGGRVVRKTTVADEATAIRSAVSAALDRTGFVIVTGGLGPTRDDITKQAVAELYGAPLELDESYLAVLRDRFAKLGRGAMPESNRTQAEIPRGATVLRNPRGTAPGLWLEGESGVTVLLPGIPDEMRKIMVREVVPRIEQRASGSERVVTASRTLRTTGASESYLADRIGDLEQQIAPVTLAYLPGLAGPDLRLTAWQLPADEAETALERAAELLRPAVGRHFYGEGDVQLAAVLLDLLRQKQLTLALAESCTGGMVGAKITAVPGSSDVFAGGVVCYSNDSKTRDLGVPAETIEQHGAVSEAVARAMVAGACHRFGAAVGIALTGIAGPGGGTEDKPRGTVWIAGQVGDALEAHKRWFPGDREEVRHRAAQAGMDVVRLMLG
jgi:nicotinamide-nucleotide amidase